MIAVIDYDMGNVRSVAKAFNVISDDVVISNSEEDIAGADRIVLPGVGAFAEGMNKLRSKGLVEILTREVLEKKKPFLGICLGMQLLAKESEEFGKHEGLGLLDARIVPFDVDDMRYKVPHVGWNDININRESFLFKGLRPGAEFYFDHSFHMEYSGGDEVIAFCDYGISFVAAVQHDNIFATQFHPEKSQTTGLKLLENFVEWTDPSPEAAG